MFLICEGVYFNSSDLIDLVHGYLVDVTQKKVFNTDIKLCRLALKLAKI